VAEIPIQRKARSRAGVVVLLLVLLVVVAAACYWWWAQSGTTTTAIGSTQGRVALVHLNQAVPHVET
jgi:multidrug resistance efflux pump